MHFLGIYDDQSWIIEIIHFIQLFHLRSQCKKSHINQSIYATYQFTLLCTFSSTQVSRFLHCVESNLSPILIHHYAGASRDTENEYIF